MSMMASKSKPLLERDIKTKTLAKSKFTAAQMLKTIPSNTAGTDLNNLKDQDIVFWCEKPITQNNLSNMSQERLKDMTFQNGFPLTIEQQQSEYRRKTIKIESRIETLALNTTVNT